MQSDASVGGLELNPNGQEMYTYEVYFPNDGVLSWSVASDGQLSFLPTNTGFPLGATAVDFPFSFTANGQYGYTTTVCEYYGDIASVQRQSNGSLEYFNAGGQTPQSPTWNILSDPCSQWVAVSSAGYAAMSFSSFMTGYTLMASYSVGPTGVLTLIPGSELVPTVNPYQGQAVFDPTGQYLILAGRPPSSYHPAVQVYQLQSDGRLVALGAPQQLSALQNTVLEGVAWDNSNHFYAVLENCGQNGPCSTELYIFNFSGGRLTLAAGAPHNFDGANPGLTVVPR
ncbi:MAG TPA: hypothetical protein VL240_04895 [Candidatus Binatia bacterium]|nr:hypothetical protein [Candidatus Binatia bacterium]